MKANILWHQEECKHEDYEDALALYDKAISIKSHPLYHSCLIECLDSYFKLNKNNKYKILEKMYQCIRTHFTKHYNLESCIILGNYIEKEKNADKRKKLYQFYASVLPISDEMHYKYFCDLTKDKVFAESKSEIKGEILYTLYKFCKNILDIKIACKKSIGDSTNNLKFVHYTKIDVLKKLLNNSQNSKYENRLRMGNVVGMNDPSEGSVLLTYLKEIVHDKNEIIDKNKVIDKYFSKKIQSSENKMLDIDNIYDVYSVSLCNNPDKMRMWIHYGDDAKGCYLKFKDCFFDLCNNQL